MLVELRRRATASLRHRAPAQSETRAEQDRGDRGGRDHEARIVHVALPDHPAESWHAPRSTGEVLRALGRAGDDAQMLPPPTGHHNAPVITPLPLQLPEVLVIPSQGAPELPGASVPVTGAPGRPPSPGRVPHPVLLEGDKQ